MTDIGWIVLWGVKSADYFGNKKFR